MSHRSASRLLASLPDGLLPEAVAAQVRSHAASCRACAASLRELELSAQLLERFPRELAPMTWDLDAETRLHAVALVDSVPRLPALDRLALRTLAAAALAVFLLGMASVGPWRVIRSSEQTASRSSWILPSAKRQSTLVAAAPDAPAVVRRGD